MKKISFILILFLGLVVNTAGVVHSQASSSTVPVISPVVNSGNTPIDQNNFVNQITVSSLVGKIGGPCINKINIPPVSLGNGSILSIIPEPVVNWINGFFQQIFDPVISLFAGPVITTMKPGLCSEGVPSNTNDPALCTCLPEKNAEYANLCTQISDPNEKATCINSCSTHGVWTAIGCIDFNIKDFITNTVFGWGLGIAGAVSFACIIYSAFAMQLSQGNPEKIKKAQETLTSCILGLLLIIFSVFLLRLIGFDILRLPGFGG